MEKYRIYRIIQGVILASKIKLSNKTLVALLVMSILAALLYFSGQALASHGAELEDCGTQPDRAECIQRVLDDEREKCDRIPDSGDRRRCNDHVDGAAGTTFTTGSGSDLECGDGGVQLGVGVGGNGEDCVGEGDQNPIFEYLGGVVSFLSVGVGVVVTAMIMVGGIQYAAAGGNPQAVEAAKSRITNAIIALVLYAFMVGILNFLVPGGVL